ncbi:FtsX-like permease family protein [Streptococcus sp. DD12]|uniref:FtsX-like permease family protein n=1 Tax=Streptococcus sp. DD12 TaxID=1777880 RepID=UPI000796F41E|nr:FtsX-like permease family protein [Streptococcus sp. DD12]KXT76538.1 ABC transporter permease protein [Streptococcus sp. DD12]
MLYLKLAFNNIKNALQQFGPFLLASTVLFVLWSTTSLIIFSSMTSHMRFGASLLFLALVILTIFAVIMEIYSYHVLLKQRSQTFGLYHILGMTKWQVAAVATWELLLSALMVILLGSLLSLILSQLFYLFFVNLVHYKQLILDVNPLALLLSSLVFGAIFLLLEIVGLVTISRQSALGLFGQSKQGESEAKGNTLLAILAILLLGIGYYLALSSNNLSALAALYRFFAAVLLVITGTYLFYISFVARYLKWRRGNKRYYYQPKHFITVSQMLFRMKQNAVGMASITLLSCMSFVAIATTTALYTNIEGQSQSLFPRTVSLTFNMANQTPQDLKALSRQWLEAKGVATTNSLSYDTYVVGIPVPDQRKTVIGPQDISHPDFNKLGYTYIVTQSDFRELGNDLPDLKENESALVLPNRNQEVKDINLLGHQLTNVKTFSRANFPDLANTYNGNLLVVSNESVQQALVSAVQAYYPDPLPHLYRFFVNLPDKQAKKLGDSQGNLLNDEGQEIGSLDLKDDFRNATYQIYGGFVFTGFMLGISFMLGAALIIYYKQYSEGQEDRRSYQILQEVGMSSQSIKKAISAQTLFVFFGPLTMAILHFLAALVLIKQVLLLFGVMDSQMVYWVSGLTILLIGTLYYLIYRFTSRTYYRIIAR